MEDEVIAQFLAGDAFSLVYVDSQENCHINMDDSALRRVTSFINCDMAQSDRILTIDATFA